jgi:hypothetical protein
VLELADGQPANPLMFNSALPPETWRPGDTFLAASDLRRFRILAIGELEEAAMSTRTVFGSSRR